MKKAKKLTKDIMALFVETGNNHVGAYAAQSAYFFILCMIPIILILLTMVKYTPITKADIMTAVIQVFPATVDATMTSIINEVYNHSVGILSVTVVVALWSAGKGVLSLSTGLNCVYKCHETRNYLYLRLRATLYTVLFILVIILLLVLAVFGNSLSIFIERHIPLISGIADSLMEARTIITPAVLVLFWLLVYKFLPNRKVKMIKQLPGAVFATVGWMAVSWVFSVYLDIFEGFSSMYGSLTTIVLIMLWLYFCMYSVLLGAEVNVLFYDKIFTGGDKEKTEKMAQK